MTYSNGSFRPLWATRLANLSFIVSMLSIWCVAFLSMGGPKMVRDLGVEAGAAYLSLGFLALAIIGAVSMVVLGRKFPQ